MSCSQANAGRGSALVAGMWRLPDCFPSGKGLGQELLGLSPVPPRLAPATSLVLPAAPRLVGTNGGIFPAADPLDAPRLEPKEFDAHLRWVLSRHGQRLASLATAVNVCSDVRLRTRHGFADVGLSADEAQLLELYLKCALAFSEDAWEGWVGDDPPLAEIHRPLVASGAGSTLLRRSGAAEAEVRMVYPPFAALKSSQPSATVVDLAALGIPDPCPSNGERVRVRSSPPSALLAPTGVRLRGDDDVVVDRRDAASPQVLPREPRRDRNWGPVTTHRIQVVALMVAGVAALFTLQDWLWGDTSKPTAWYGQAWSWASTIWLSAFIPSIVGLLGMLWYRHPNDLEEVEPITNLVVWRIVSRGSNIEALHGTIQRCHDEMRRAPLFPYVVEVVTDHPNRLEVGNDTTHLVVPPTYQTPNNSLFKARALQYALENSTVPDDAWLVHLDEETRPTSSGIKGIARMIAEEEASGELRIGQGAILYHRAWKEHPFLTLADMVRTGDDFARFHFQHRIGLTLFGLHGSFIVCRNDVEKEIGFDFGPQGSITEDAFWALKAMEAGRRARWCDGYLEEQSTLSVMDFIKQRRRWWQGLAKVSLYAPVRLRYRAFLGFNTVTWMLAPVALLYTYIHFIWGYEIRDWIQWFANLAFTAFIVLYLTGLRANLAEHGISNPLRRAGWYVAQVVLMPIFALMESVGVAYAIVRPSAGFHVVKK